MRHVLKLIPLLLILAGAIACGEDGSEPKLDTPQAAFAEIRAACADKDPGRLFDLCHKLDRIQFKKMKKDAATGSLPLDRLSLGGVTAEEIGAMDLREFSKLVILEFLDRPGRQVLETLAAAEPTGEPEVRDDKCVISWRTPGEAEGRTRLRLEDGAWRLSMGELYIPSKDRENQVRCLENLRQLGGLLTVQKVSGKDFHKRSGPAFLLQVSEEMDHLDLMVYRCPGEPADNHPVRPALGSSDLFGVYADVRRRPDKVEDFGLFTSYYGANWKDFPPDPTGMESRIWACCPHHDGVIVLWDSSKVSFIEKSDLKLGGPGGDEIILGPDSPDPRLRTVIFNRAR